MSDSQMRGKSQNCSQLLGAVAYSTALPSTSNLERERRPPIKVIGACEIYGNSRCRSRQRGSDGASHIKLKRYGKRWRTVERDRRQGSAIAGERTSGRG